MARMLNTGFHDKMFHLKGHDFQQHCNSVGQYLRDLRVKRDLSTADIGIICAFTKTDYLHSIVGAVHSNYIRMILKERKTPFRISAVNCQYSAVSSVIDWMYTGEISITPDQYGEFLKVVGTLGINKLQQSLEEALELLSKHNNCLIYCLNIATDPDCLVSSVVRGVICAQFIANMQTLSDGDIQSLASNAVMKLVSSPRIRGMEKIDVINFALQWLKNEDHIQYLDPVLGSFYIETLGADQLVALVQHLRQLFQELPRTNLETVHVYRRGRRVVVSGDPEKYAQTSNVIVPRPSTDLSGWELDDHTCAEVNRVVGPEISASQIEEIKQLPNFDDIQEDNSKSFWKLKQPDVYRLSNSGSQELINARDFSPEDLIDHEHIPDLFAKHRVLEEHGFSCRSSNLVDRQLTGGGSYGDVGFDTFRQQPNVSDENGGYIGSSEKSQSTQSDYDSKRDDLVLEFQRPGKSDSKGTKTATDTDTTLNRYAYGPESICDINSLPDQFSAYSLHTKASAEQRLAAAGTSDQKSTQTIGRHSFGSHSLADISDIPNQFSRTNSVCTTGARTAISAGERTMGRNTFGAGSFTEQQVGRRNRSCETLNRRAFGPESVVEINSLPVQFIDHSGNFEYPRIPGGSGMVAHPYELRSAFPNQASTHTEDEYAAQTQTVANPHDQWSARSNQASIPRGEQNPTQTRTIVNLYDVWCAPSNQASISRGEQIPTQRRTVASPHDPWSAPSNQASIPGAVENPSETRKLDSPTDTVNWYAYGAESVTDIQNLPNQFHSKRYYTPNLDHYPGGRRAVYNLTEQIRCAKEGFFNSGYCPEGSEDLQSAENGCWPNRLQSRETDLKTVNRYAFGEQSLTDIKNIPSQFTDASHKTSGGRSVQSEAEVVGHRLFSSASLADIRDIPDQFSRNMMSEDYVRRSPSQEVINRRLYSAPSLSDINAIPDQFSRRDDGSRIQSPSQNVINRREFSKESATDIRAIPDQFLQRAPLLGPNDRRAFSCEVPSSSRSMRARSPISYQEWKRNLEKRRGIELRTPLHSKKSPGSLIQERSFGTTRSSCTSTSSPTEHKEHPNLRYTASEIMDINAYPEFVREDHVIGKKALTREEHEDLREIPSISGWDPDKLPIVNRYEISEEELEDIKKLPNIVGSQYTIGRRLRTDEELQEIRAIPDIKSKETATSREMMQPQAQMPPSRQSFESPASTGPAISSAYLASDMYSQDFDSPFSSEYLVHGTYGTHEKRMY